MTTPEQHEQIEQALDLWDQRNSTIIAPDIFVDGYFAGREAREPEIAELHADLLRARGAIDRFSREQILREAQVAKLEAELAAKGSGEVVAWRRIEAGGNYTVVGNVSANYRAELEKHGAVYEPLYATPQRAAAAEVPDVFDSLRAARNNARTAAVDNDYQRLLDKLSGHEMKLIGAAMLAASPALSAPATPVVVDEALCEQIETMAAYAQELASPMPNNPEVPLLTAKEWAWLHKKMPRSTNSPLCWKQEDAVGALATGQAIVIRADDPRLAVTVEELAELRRDATNWGATVQAIRLFRDQHGVSLHEAKDAVFAAIAASKDRA